MFSPDSSVDRKPSTLRAVRFTINNPKVSELVFPDWVSFYIYQLEKGESGTPHFQGYMEFLSPQRFERIKKLRPTAHIERRRSSSKACIDYCSKVDSRISGPWTSGTPKVDRKLSEEDVILAMKERRANNASLADIYKAYPAMANKYSRWLDVRRSSRYTPIDRSNFTPRDWQKKVIDIIEGPFNDRHIIWIYDFVGGSGKTVLANYLVFLKKAYYIRGGKADNIKYRYNNQPLVIFDYARGNLKKFNYSLIEEFKDGTIDSHKYHGARKGNPKTNVLVFSNERPDTSRLSHDRWRLIALNPPFTTLDSVEVKQPLASLSPWYLDSFGFNTFRGLLSYREGGNLLPISVYTYYTYLLGYTPDYT